MYNHFAYFTCYTNARPVLDYLYKSGRRYQGHCERKGYIVMWD